MLDAHTDKIAAYSVSSDFDGFVALVHDHNSYPLISQKGIRIQPGKENLVAISAIDVIGGDGLRDVPPDRRGCYFPDEHTLKLYSNYSQVSRNYTGCSEILVSFGNDRKCFEIIQF